MAALHLVDREGNMRATGAGPREYESVGWALSEATLQAVVGGRVYFHHKQTEPSFMGGDVLGFREVTEVPRPPRKPRRFAITFVADPEGVNVRTDREGWPNFFKFVP
jgi:hypothetical protein